MLIDSCASHSMITNKNQLINYTLWQTPHNVTLADGSTTTPILGRGTLQAYSTSGQLITIPNCLHVPNLSASLLATKAFSLIQNHNIKTTNGITTINFPSFQITTDDPLSDALIYINLYKHKPTPTTSHLTISQPTSLPKLPPPSPELISTDSLQTNQHKTNHDETLKHNSLLDNDITNTMSKLDIKPTLHTWLKTKIKVSFRDNNGIVHRGVLAQKSLHRWSLIIRKSKRLAQILEFSTVDVSNLHDNGRLLPGHQHLLSNDPSPTPDEVETNHPKPNL